MNVFQLLNLAGILITMGGKFSPQESLTGTLVIEVTNLESGDGVLRIAVFNESKGFPDENRRIGGVEVSIPAGVSKIKAELPDVPLGICAVAVYHDCNNNGKLDKNMFGIPVEPYGFSNNPAVKWRGPRYEEAAFEFSEDHQQVGVELRRWEEW